MTDVREATDDLLAERPDLESDLRELLAVDDREDGWRFDDVPFDSGVFGELVSRNIVAKTGDEYELADSRAVRASLDGDATVDSDAGRSWNPSGSFSADSLSSLSFPSVSRIEASALAAVLGFVLLMRTYIYPSVFRGEYVVLSSNDPYHYRYWVEQLAAEATGVFDLSVLSGLPSAVAKGEPLTVATLWWLTNLLGGADASGVVLAWYPVVSALVVAVLTYAIAVSVTSDRRVGLAAVALLAVVPAFTFRTGLGFADHHAFDYPWLALTALALVRLADVDREGLRDAWIWLVAGVLGVAVAGQTMAWDASPVILGGIVVYVAVRAVADVRADRSPLVASAPILAGLTLASVLSHLAHTGFGWHTGMVAYAPALLLAGVAGVSLVGEAVRRAEMPGFVLGAAEVAGGFGGLVLLQTLLPSYWAQLSRRLDFLLFRTGPAETQSMFAGGPSGFFLGPILELGFAWVLGLPMLAVASWRAYRRDRPAWLVVCTYGWYFLVLAALQRRFVGELAPFFAVLAGYGFVVLAAKLDVTAPPAFEHEADGRARSGRTRSPVADGGRSLSIPDRGTITALAILLLFVTSAGAVQTAVRHEQVKIDGEKFEAAAWMDGYAEKQGWEYPENYVLSKWGRNRVYNYFVNGEARSYSFAEQHYEKFLSSRNPEAQYQKLKDKVGFLVTKDISQSRIPPESNYARLHQRFGSVGPNGASGASHYRAVYASDDGSVKVFTLVPGAKVVGNASPGETVTISRRVEIEGKTFTYERKVTANPYGVFSVTVPYAGEYSVKGATKAVSEGAPTTGKLVKWHDRAGLAHWSFEKVRDGKAFDRVGGHRASLTSSVSTMDGASGQGIAFDGKNASVTANVSASQEFTISLWVNPKRLDTTEGNDYRHLVKGKGGNLVILEQSGRVSFRVPGVERSYFAAGDIALDEWSHVAVTYNGSHRTIYVDGELVRSDRVGKGMADWGGQLRIGNGYGDGNAHAFEGAIDEVRIDGRALTASEVRERYESRNRTTGRDE